MALRDYFKNPLIEAAYAGMYWMKKNNHLKMLKLLDQSQYYSPQRLRELQIKKLRQLILTAFESSPFWKKRFDSIGLERGDIDGLKSPEKIPVLTKRDIIEKRDQILIREGDGSRLIKNRSGGTTGSPLLCYLDSHKAAVRKAATIRHNLWSNFKIGDRQAIIWSAPGDFGKGKSKKTRLRELFWGRHVLLDAANISQVTMADFADRWRKFKPEVILAYAGALDIFVDFLISHSIQIPGIRTIITSAEVLTDRARVKIENYFGVKVFDRYGCREVSLIGSECDGHDGLHVNAENLWLEFEPIQKDKEGRQAARVLITDLENHVFPFIRYRLGDVVIIDDSEKPCPCGRTLPKIISVAGRISEYIRSGDGRYISGTGLTINLLSKAPGILKAQIVQKSLNNILLRIVKNDNFDDNSIRILKKEFGKLVGEKVSLEFEYPERIEREKSGKYRLVISEIDK